GYILKVLAERGEEREVRWEGCVSPPLRVSLSGTEMDIWVEDTHCRFNLNNLAGDNEAAAAGFIRLLEGLRTEYPHLAFAPAQAAAATRDWMDPQTADPVYRLATPPYLSANRRMMVAGELRWVQGVSDDLWRALAPHVTALPAGGTGMNVEHASP